MRSGEVNGLPALSEHLVMESGQERVSPNSWSNAFFLALKSSLFFFLKFTNLFAAGRGFKCHSHFSFSEKNSSVQWSHGHSTSFCEHPALVKAMRESNISESI
jgi:hypothetical protein